MYLEADQSGEVTILKTLICVCDVHKVKTHVLGLSLPELVCNTQVRHFPNVGQSKLCFLTIDGSRHIPVKRISE